jgi:hypothetical protein
VADTGAFNEGMAFFSPLNQLAFILADVASLPVPLRDTLFPGFKFQVIVSDLFIDKVDCSIFRRRTLVCLATISVRGWLTTHSRPA